MEARIVAWPLQMLGAGLVLVALADIFLTVLYARSGVSVLSNRVYQGGWGLFRSAALALPSYKDRLLAFAGPTLLVSTVFLWVVLLSMGECPRHFRVQHGRSKDLEPTCTPAAHSCHGSGCNSGVNGGWTEA